MVHFCELSEQRVLTTKLSVLAIYIVQSCIQTLLFDTLVLSILVSIIIIRHMPVTVLGDVMGTTQFIYHVRKYSVYIHGQNIDPDWLEGFGFGARIQLQLPYQWIQHSFTSSVLFTFHSACDMIKIVLASFPGPTQLSVAWE